MSQNFFYPPSGAGASTVTANQGLPNTDANAWPVRITDGVDDAGVTPAGALMVDTSSSGPMTVNQGTSPWVTSTTNGATEATLAAFSAKTAGAFVPEAFDYADITYIGATTDINTVVYKTGGSGGSTVATLTMGYDGSNRLNAITKT